MYGNRRRAAPGRGALGAGSGGGGGGQRGRPLRLQPGLSVVDERQQG